MASARPNKNATSAMSTFSCLKSFSLIRLRPINTAHDLGSVQGHAPTPTIPAYLHMNKAWENKVLLSSRCL